MTIKKENIELRKVLKTYPKKRGKKTDSHVDKIYDSVIETSQRCINMEDDPQYTSSTNRTSPGSLTYPSPYPFQPYD